MGNIRRFAAINTKIKGMERRLLQRDDYLNMLHKKSVAEIGAYLKERTDYAVVLKGVQTEHIRRDMLEQLIQNYVDYQFEKLFHYFIDEYRKFIKFLYQRYEIENLKLYLRALTRGENLAALYQTVEKPASLPYEKMAQAQNMEELVNYLRQSPYYLVLSPLLQEEEDKRLFHMEMHLDIQYFCRLQEQSVKLGKEDRRLLEEILGVQVDLLNLQWIYRGIRFYGLSPEELFNYMLPGGQNYGFRKIKELCYAKDERDFIQRLGESPYDFLFDNQQTQDIFMERRIARYFYFLFQKYKKHEKMNMGEAMIYIHLLEYQRRDIISMIEAIRYGLEEDEVKRYLIRKL
ncbi:MAG: V-type ATPase subunit [Thermotaleaceae bacterium]